MSTKLLRKEHGLYNFVFVWLDQDLFFVKQRESYEVGAEAIEPGDVKLELQKMAEASDAVWLPRQLAIDGDVDGNVVSQLRRDELTTRAQIEPFALDGVEGQLVVWGNGTSTLVVPDRVISLSGIDEILRIPDGTVPRADSNQQLHQGPIFWINPQPRDPRSIDPEEWVKICTSVRASWEGRFFFRQEQHRGDDVLKEGLRPPQIGALHAALAHWTVSDDAATIVMPTGTGKTETMLAILTSQRLERLLVVVPTVTLREQIASKFRELGLLKRLGVLSAEAGYPVVGVLEHYPTSPASTDAFLRCCNVVVATMQAVNGCSEEIRRVLVDRCSHLFVDEAHHVPAATWSDFHRRFFGKPILHFTATPFRNDGKLVSGKVIFEYPLKQAQEEGYFKPINFRPVWAYSDADDAIAAQAVDQLKKDSANKRDHIVMARVATIERAELVRGIYQRIAPEYAPLLIHSKLTGGSRKDALQRLRARRSRIIICVDMLGEGFDLPQLKIAAMHDIHRSLAITLQFIGRFTRTSDNSIGDATAIANLADVNVEESLRTLYAEDSDWNAIISDLGTGATQHHVRRSEFMGSFTDLPVEIPIQNIQPKMSTVAYRTEAQQWHPERIADVVGTKLLYVGPTVSYQHKVAWFVTREAEYVRWGRVKQLENVLWHLYLVHWDEEHGLLFINSSNNDSTHDQLADAIVGETTRLIKDEQLYRVMAGIKRLIPNNLGLSHVISRNVRHTSLFGADVAEGFDPVRARNKTKSYVFGRGYEGGTRTSIGCSAKGRIWSHEVAGDIAAWVEWCHHVGRKLLDDHIDLDEVFNNFVLPEPVTVRPTLVPLAMEWPGAFLERSEETVMVSVGDETVAFYEAGLELITHEREGPIRFRVATSKNVAEYAVHFNATRTRYVAAGEEAVITVGNRELPVSEWFRREPPKFLFEQDTFIENDLLVKVKTDGRDPFPRERIQEWDWTGVDFGKESQRDEKRPDSIQRRVIERLIEQDYDIVFDDDDPGEVADVVALRATADRFVVHLYHCKFSDNRTAGARVHDLYAVCGQAQTSIHWREEPERLLKHLVIRNAKREKDGRPSRFEHGDLRTLSEMSRRQPVLLPDYKIFIVQPGLSKARANIDQLELLAATNLLLQETFAIDFQVIASP